MAADIMIVLAWNQGIEAFSGGGDEMARRQEDYDVVVIGGGPAGVEAALRSAGYGLRTLLIDRQEIGGGHARALGVAGTALRHAADMAHSLSTGGGVFPPYGLPEHASSAALGYVAKILDLSGSLDDTQEKLARAGVETRIGCARFVGQDEIELDGERIAARDFVLCTGSSPALPDVPGLEEATYRTTRDILEMETAPESLGIIGAGPVGIELAQAFSRLGTKVVVLGEGDRILPDDDIELTSWLADCLRAEGVDIRLDACLEAVQRDGDGFRLMARGYGGPSEASCKSIVVASGIVPNVADLNLAAAGVQATARGVKTDATLHTTGPRVWACGDVRGVRQYAHIAVQEARRAVRNIFLPMNAAEGPEAACWTTFTDPQLAHLGVTEEEALDLGLAYEVIREPFSLNDGAVAMRATTGVIKVIVEPRRGRILGVHILGENAGEVINEWALAMRSGLSLKAIADSPHVQFTLGSSSERAARRWADARSSRPAARNTLATYRTLRANKEPVIYTLAAVGVAAGLLWAVRSLASDEDE